MTFPERDVRKMIAKSGAVRWRVRELIWTSEPVSSYRLERIRRLLMFVEQEVWKREGCFDEIDIIAEMHAQTLRRLYASFDSEPLDTGLRKPQWPHNLEEYTLKMNTEVRWRVRELI